MADERTVLDLIGGICDAAEKAFGNVVKAYDVAASNAPHTFINTVEARRGNQILDAETTELRGAAGEIILAPEAFCPAI
jgi:hypothetical protein